MLAIVENNRFKTWFSPGRREQLPSGQGLLASATDNQVVTTLVAGGFEELAVTKATVVDDAVSVGCFAS